MKDRTARCRLTHLLVGLEHVALEYIARAVPGDVAPDLKVLRVMGHVENPERKKSI